ncbi:hypothetical protein HYH03_016540 [Edaphochlamys debaryana]|uniref:Uncharacterized protein n=1 Tax=Edaphochlamys debaryana TaxID=47281 RepID=A0A835XHE9_9CHLO|nr:hypothetical protein HYH03_016540 [Edaphochlamys debaryana]|eukprot:KAG2484712.1 hypothetical protein HYH03_016540 [Edaphochlamys debaryana]
MAGRIAAAGRWAAVMITCLAGAALHQLLLGGTLAAAAALTAVAAAAVAVAMVDRRRLMPPPDTPPTESRPGTSSPAAPQQLAGAHAAVAIAQEGALYRSPFTSSATCCKVPLPPGADYQAAAASLSAKARDAVTRSLLRSLSSAGPHGHTGRGISEAGSEGGSAGPCSPSFRLRVEAVRGC